MVVVKPNIKTHCGVQYKSHISCSILI